MDKNVNKNIVKTDKKTDNQKPESKSLLRKFLLTAGISFVAFFVVAVGIVAVFNIIDGGATISGALGLEPQLDEDGNPITSGVFGGLFQRNLPERTNVLLLGTDEAFGGSVGRADLIMIASVHNATGEISLISVPRDARVVMPPERLETLREHGRNSAPSSGVMRINEVMSHSGRQLGPSFTAKQVGEILDIEIHYYVHLDLEGFRAIIDQIGGIEFYVPRRMFYVDPYQDLVIDLQPGLQHLTGSAAEGLMRFRGYGDGDLGRMRTQQAFMVEAARQVMDMDNIMGNPMVYLNVFLNHMDTNFGLVDMPAYLSLLGRLDMANMATATLPGRGTSINGRYFHVLDEDGVQELIAQMFNARPAQPEESLYMAEEPEEPVNSLGLDIAILNGAGVAGLAARASETLTEYGYTIVSIGNYTGQAQYATRILVREEGIGRDLASFFPDSTIEIDRTISADIMIILGTSSN